MLVPRRLIAGVLMLVAVTGVAACGGSSSGPQPLPPLTASDSPAPSPSANPPTSKPAELAAAKQVVKRYFAAKNALSRRMDTAPLVAITTRTCACREVVTQAQHLSRKGEHYFGVATVRSVTPTVDSPTTAEALVTYDSTVGGIMTVGGRVVYEGSAHRGVTQLFFLRLVDGTWLVDDIKLVKQGSSK